MQCIRAGNESTVHNQAKTFLAKELENKYKDLFVFKYDGVWMEYPLVEHNSEVENPAFSHSKLITRASYSKRLKLLSLAEKVTPRVFNLANTCNPKLRQNTRRKIRVSAKRLNLIKIVDICVVVGNKIVEVHEIVHTHGLKNSEKKKIHEFYPVELHEISSIELGRNLI